MSSKVKVYLAIDGPRPQVLELRDSSFGWVEYEEGSIHEPSMVLDKQILEAFLREATNFVPATDATTKHLDDTVIVRDRLLTLVESFAHPPRYIIPGETHGKE